MSLDLSLAGALQLVLAALFAVLALLLGGLNRDLKLTLGRQQTLLDRAHEEIDRLLAEAAGSRGGSHVA